jgi:hypothetical protein
MRSQITVIILFVLALVPLAGQDKVRVYITSIGAQNGFTDPSKDNQDSVKDLKYQIGRKRTLTLAESPGDAAIQLIVLGRETAQVTAGLFGDPARDRMVRVRFVVGEFTTELTASAQGGTLGSGGSWNRAADKIAGQVEDWVKTNRAKLP